MTAHVSILCTGNEILDGRIEDSNSRYLISALANIGVSVRQILACRDEISSIRDSISYLFSDCDVLIISGGLGPTSDDLTREAVAAYLGKSLYLDSDALHDLQELYRRRKRHFDGSNTKQAQFPEGSRILKNPVGTAAGFHCTSKQSKHILVVPGVPHEMKRMCTEHILPFATKHFGLQGTPRSFYLHVFGRPESKVGELVESKGVPAAVRISYRAHYPEIIVKISAEGDDALAERFTMQAKQLIGTDYVYSELELATFEHSVHTLLVERQKTVAVAESCTGGMVGGLLTSNAGASSFFLGGAITYSNESKTKLLGVPAALIEKHGAVSQEVAKQMAESARNLFSSDLAVSITGIAGPDGGSEDKPVGTFYVGFATRNSCEAFHCFASASRSMVRTFAAYTALDIIRRHVLGHELRPRDIIGVPQSMTDAHPSEGKA
ncbi:MAG: competence/damage-inducible protein A [Deltaproteobacteria bacterium]|nr:competence/damage-inducible protein A [Deltaproteobacteria bacterium]